MRDDDDSFGEDTPEGNLYFSGIRPTDDIEPADYALPPGTSALQDEPLEDWEEPSELSSISRRRRFLVVAASAVSVGSVLFYSGFAFADEGKNLGEEVRRGVSGKRLTREDLRLIRVARSWATRPIDVLAGSAPAFLWVFTVVEPDDAMNLGLKRLCDYATLDGGVKGYETALHVLETFEEIGTPPGFEHHVKPMQQVVLSWKLANRRGR